MPRFDAVLFDFSDTLFWRDGSTRIAALAVQCGVDLERDPRPLRLWAEVRARSVSASELAKRRDSSAEAHRRCWTELYRPFDALAPDADPPLSVHIYNDSPNPEGWRPYSDTVPVLCALAEAGIPIGVVTDIGWDVRPVFNAHGAGSFVGAFVQSFEEGTEKPDPVMFLAACDRLGVAPSRTLMVGDSITKDGGAAAAGLTAHVVPAWSGDGHRGLVDALSLLGLPLSE